MTDRHHRPDGTRVRMNLNPEPLGLAASDDARFISSLTAWNRTATRADRLRVWLATGGTQADFDEDHPSPPAKHDLEFDTNERGGFWRCLNCDQSWNRREDITGECRREEER